jgi:hypothetical protein
VQHGLALVLAFLAPVLPVRAEEPKEIIEKAIRAHGGEAKLAKTALTRTKGKGTMDVSGVTIAFTVESVSQVPDKLRTVHAFDVMGQRQTVTTVFDSDQAWQSRNGMAIEIKGPLLEELRHTLHFRRIESLLPLVKDKEFTLASLPEITVDEKLAVGVKVSAKGRRDCSLYFDKETGLLVRVIRKMLDLNQQEVDTETTYKAWKDFEGLKLPTKVVVQQGGKKLQEAEVLEYKFLDKIDPSDFAKP